MNAFQGFDANPALLSCLNTKSVSTNNVPETCDGYRRRWLLPRLIRSTEDIQDTVLGVCSYFSGGPSFHSGATHSERADSTTFRCWATSCSTKEPVSDGF